MPISVLNIIPRAAEQIAHPGLKKTDWGFADIEHGRYITLLFCMLTGIFIYKWSKNLYGEKAGIFSLFLFVFCPNKCECYLMAHAFEHLLEVKRNNLKFDEFPVTIKYTDYSINKGQKVSNSVQIIFHLIIAKIFE